MAVVDSRSSAIDACIESALARQRLPGLSLAIGQGGRITYVRGFGCRNLPYRIAADEQTIYNIAS